MPTNSKTADTFKDDPIGPGTPAWEAREDATMALVHCFKQIQPHAKRLPYGENIFAIQGHSILAEALKRHETLTA